MRRAGVCSAVVVVLLSVTGCGGGGGKATPAATPSAVVTTTSPPAGVKLSTKWTPKLDALTAAGGTAACREPGSGACTRALTGTLEELTAFLGDVKAAGADAQYPKAVAQATAMVAAATRYSEHECPGDPNAGMEGSPCTKDAWDVTVGVSALQVDMMTDELTAGVG